MAISNIESSTLQLIFETGTDENGFPIFSGKSFNKVKTDATDDQLYAIASALQPLQVHSLFEVKRKDDSVITPSPTA
jgi:hypothetical protein